MKQIPSKHDRWPLFRQAIIFQLKLGLDALRDILMSPVSIVLVIADIVMANNHQQSYFVRLMRLGKKSDHWINLFGVDLSSTHTKYRDKDNKAAEESHVDYWFMKVEEVIKEHQVDGKISQSGIEKLKQYFGRGNQASNNSESEN